MTNLSACLPYVLLSALKEENVCLVLMRYNTFCCLLCLYGIQWLYVMPKFLLRTSHLVDFSWFSRAEERVFSPSLCAEGFHDVRCEVLILWVMAACDLVGHLWHYSSKYPNTWHVINIVKHSLPVWVPFKLLCIHSVLSVAIESYLPGKLYKKHDGTACG